MSLIPSFVLHVSTVNESCLSLSLVSQTPALLSFLSHIISPKDKSATRPASALDLIKWPVDVIAPGCWLKR